MFSETYFYFQLYNYHLILVVDQYNHCSSLGDGVCLFACFPVVMIWPRVLKKGWYNMHPLLHRYNIEIIEIIVICNFYSDETS